MEVRILKLSNEKGAADALTSKDILSEHLGFFSMNEKVTYSTGIPISTKPDYVLLTLGNIQDICYLCHVAGYAYKGKDIFFSPEDAVFNDHLPDKYKGTENISWLLFDSIQKIPTDFLDIICKEGKITDFIQERANNKRIKSE